jgi:hypothetical protein
VKLPFLIAAIHVDLTVTDANPTGDLTISEFELAATFTHHDLIVHAVDLREHTTHNLNNNTAMIYWQRKGSTTTTTTKAAALKRQNTSYVCKLSFNASIVMSHTTTTCRAK